MPTVVQGEPWAIVKDIFPYKIETELLQSSKMIRGLPSETKSVYPECAVLSPEGLSDIDIRNDVMHGNRSDVYDPTQRVIGSGSNLTESGNDANSEIDERMSRLSA